MGSTRVSVAGAGLSILFSLILIALPTTVLGQATTASVQGTVSDETKGALPGVTVTITNVETGASRTAVTDAQGRYFAPQLALGEYEIKADLAGFQTTLRRGIQLTLGREAVVDMMLRIGDLQEHVVVSGEAPLVESTNAMVSGHVDSRQMRELPLNGRSYIDLALLQAGTVQARTAGSGYDDKGTQLAVAGARPTSTTFLLDGTITTSTRGKAPASVTGSALGVDAIQEFEVITSPYNAEYGRGTGGTISVVSKAGKNTLFGSLFGFLRNSALDARNYFDNPASPPDFRRHQLGFSVGGPIVRNRTFFFGNYEGLRQSLGVTDLYRVPTDAVRQGIVNGQRMTIKPEVLPYLLLYPRVNGKDFGDGSGEYVNAFTRPTTENYFTTRIDHQFSDSHAYFTRYTFDKGMVSTPTSVNMFVEDARSSSQFLTAELKSVYSSHLFNVARFGYTRQYMMDTERQLVDAPGLSLAPGMNLPRLSVSPLSTFGSVDQLPRGYRDNTFEVFDSLTYVRGRHTLKAGVQFQAIQNWAVGNQRQTTRWNFSSITNFLQGRATRLEHSPRELADPIRNLRQKFLATFLQDDVKLAPRLTLNAGVRLEYASTMTETDGKLSHLAVDKFATATLDDYLLGDPWYKNPGLAVGPRIGVAWDPFGTGRTAIRTGYGVFYDHFWAHWMSGTGSFRMSPYFTTFDLRETVNFPMTSSQIVALMRGRQGRQIPVGNQVFQPDDDPKLQVVQQYGFDVQHQLAGAMVVKVGYKGSHGSNLPRVVDTNYAVPLSVDDGWPRFSATPVVRNPAFGEMTITPTDTMSSYNALLMEVSKRFNQGFQFQVSYTFAKMIDEAAGVRTSGDAATGAGGGYSLGYAFPHLDRALSTFDVRHNLVTNFLIELPVGEGRRFDMKGAGNALLGGWDVNTIVTVASGNPAEFSQGTTTATSIISVRRRPDLKPGGNNNPVLGGPDQYYDPTQFNSADPLHYGNVGRNTLTGPGYATVDMSLSKNIRIGGLSSHSRLQLRAELFNVLNRANFGLPNMQVFNGAGQLNGSAGRITTTSGAARQVQLGARLTW